MEELNRNELTNNSILVAYPHLPAVCCPFVVGVIYFRNMLIERSKFIVIPSQAPRIGGEMKEIETLKEEDLKP